MTLIKKTIEFVKANPGSTWAQIQGYMLSLKGLTRCYDTRGWYSSYFSDSYMSQAKLMHPDPKDSTRGFLIKVEGKYYVTYDNNLAPEDPYTHWSKNNMSDIDY